VVDVLLAEGVRAVFGLPGGHVLGIYDALYDTPEIRHVLVATSRRRRAWRRPTPSSRASRECAW